MKFGKAIVAAIVLFSLGTVYCEADFSKTGYTILRRPDGTYAGAADVRIRGGQSLYKFKLLNVAKSQWFGLALTDNSNVGPNCTLNYPKEVSKIQDWVMSSFFITPSFALGDSVSSVSQENDGRYSFTNTSIVVYSISRNLIDQTWLAIQTYKSPYACGQIKMCFTCGWTDGDVAFLSTDVTTPYSSTLTQPITEETSVVLKDSTKPVEKNGKYGTSGSKINPAPKATFPLVPMENPLPLDSNQKPVHIPIVDKVISTIFNYFVRKLKFIKSWFGFK